MFINYIELENIRSYSNKTKIEFKDGINLISGDIGSGKSSILLALEFAIFGISGIKDLDSSMLLRKGAEEGTVVLKIVNENGKNFNHLKIFRKLKRGNKNIKQTEGFLEVDGVLEQYSPTELDAIIFQFLNFPKNSKNKNLIYRFTIYTPQEQLKEILFSSSDRVEVIRKILDIDKYKLICEGLKIYKKDLELEKKELIGKLDVKKDIENELKELEKEKIEKIKTLKIINENLNKIKKIIDEKNEIKNKYETKKEELLNKEKEQSMILKILEKEISELNNIKKEILDIEKNLNIKGNKNNLEKNIEKLNLTLEKKNETKNLMNLEIKNLKEKILNIKEKKKIYDNLNLHNKSIEDKIVFFNENIKNISNKKSEFVRKENLLNEEIKKLTKFIENKEELLTELKKFENENHELEKKNYEKENTIKKIKKNFEILKRGNKCPLCHQIMNEEHRKKVFSEYETEIKKNEDLLKQNLDLINKNKSKIKELEFKINEIEKNEDLLKRKKINLEEIKKQKIKVDEEIKDLEQKKILLKKDLRSIELEKIKKYESDIMKLETFETDLEKKDLEFQKLFNEIENLNKEKTDLEIKLKDFNFHLQRKNDLEKEKLNLENSIKKKGKSKEIIKLIQINLDKINKKIVELNNLIEELEKKRENNNIKKNIIETEIKNIELNLNKDKIRLDELKKVENNYRRLDNNSKLIENKFIPLFYSIEMKVLTKFNFEFTELFQEYFYKLVEDENTEVSIDSNFQILVNQKGYDLDLKYLSGGEKSAVAISYRLTLKKIINDYYSFNNYFSTLILDEPTDGFSDDQIVRLGNLLKELNSKQIILVSHDKKLESISTNIIKVFKKNHITQIKNE